ncbi:MAG: hypothetical protein KAJ06_09865 [Gammaproteobacteria bacterium]|nr:hypothetical protein [Gammaproteobacteria bacterium]
MALAVKSVSASGAKWARRAGSAGTEYEEGVRSPKKSWATETVAAAPAYDAGVQAAIGRNAFQNGVKKAGDSKWQQNAIAKGPQRYSQGVALAQTDYETAVAPFNAALSNLTLPKRGPKGDPSNINRVAMIAKTLHDVKLQQQGK